MTTEFRTRRSEFAEQMLRIQSEQLLEAMEAYWKQLGEKTLNGKATSERTTSTPDPQILKKPSDQTLVKRTKLRVEDAIVTIRKGVTLEDIMREQPTKRLSFEELQEITQGIEWEDTIDEMLEALKD